MNEKVAKALARALAHCCSVGDSSLEGFMDRAVWEISHECSGEFGSMAIVIRREDGSSYVARPKEASSLPVETLLGMLVEESGSKLTCRVRDHALDTVRFIDASFRSSVVSKLLIPKSLLAKSDAILWFGLFSVATSKRIDLARIISEALSEWLALYAPVLESLKLCNERIMGLRARLDRVTALAHDVKAPIGALKYLISDTAAEYPQIYEEAGRLQEELGYAESLLSGFAPCESGQQKGSGVLKGVEIARVVKRVVDRFERQASERGCRLKLDLPFGASGIGKIEELCLERAVSNVIGNASKYSNPGEVRIEILRSSNSVASKGSMWIVRVSDSGPGIPKGVIDSLALGERTLNQNSVVSAGGWGVGLLSTKASLVSHGGDLKVHSDASGSRVDICIPAAVAGFSANSSYRDSLSCISNFETSSATSLSDGGIDNSYGDVQLILVDDDVDHTESLERTLRRKGISAKSFKAVEDAFNFIATDVNVTVLCDTHMPNNQGAEYLLRLLSHANLKPTIGVMSGESSDFSLYRFAALGAREFFSKPIDIERLVDWVAQNNATSTVSKSAL